MLRISGVRFTAAKSHEQQSGLLGYVSYLYFDMRLDGVTLRKKRCGTLGLSFPERTDRQGNRHPLIRPVDDATRIEIEAEVLRQLADEMERIAA